MLQLILSIKFIISTIDYVELESSTTNDDSLISSHTWLSIIHNLLSQFGMTTIQMRLIWWGRCRELIIKFSWILIQFVLSTHVLICESPSRIFWLLSLIYSRGIHISWSLIIKFVFSIRFRNWNPSLLNIGWWMARELVVCYNTLMSACDTTIGDRSVNVSPN